MMLLAECNDDEVVVVDISPVVEDVGFMWEVGGCIDRSCGVTLDMSKDSNGCRCVIGVKR